MKSFNFRRWFIILLAFVIGVVVTALVFSAGKNPGEIPVEETENVFGQNINGGDETPIASTFPSPTPIELIEVVIAIQDIPRGLTIPPNVVAIRQYPLELVQEWGATVLSDSEDVIGQRARTDIARFQPIFSNMVVELPSILANVGSDMAVILPPEQVSITLYIPSGQLPQGLQPGDSVDIIHSIPTGDNPNSNDAESGVTLQYVTQRTVQNALVLWVGEVRDDGRLFFGPPTPTPVPPPDEAGVAFRSDEIPTPSESFGFESYLVQEDGELLVPITLAVSPQDSVDLMWATTVRLPIGIVSRAATSNPNAETRTTDLGAFAHSYDFILPGTEYPAEMVPTVTPSATLQPTQLSTATATDNN